MRTPAPGADPRALARPLVAWYRRRRRDLPWRRTADPYRIWVSEVMLQQTRVAAVVPHYERFVARFPDVESLAAAAEEQVLAAWSGLGYYRRARSLHRGAAVVVAEHGGRVPEDLEALRSLPGIGAYTAGAIASIAYGRSEPALDGNVRRVLARAFAIDETGAPGERRLDGLARAIVARGNAGELNQALMELGALVCTPAAPRCGDCPVRPHCAAFATGRTSELPAPRPRARPTDVAVAVAWIVRGGTLDTFLVERPSAAGPLRGTWDVPAVEVGAGVDRALTLEAWLLARHGLEVEAGLPVASVAHSIMDRRLRLDVLPCRLVRGRVAGRPGLRWHALAALDELAASGATRKVARVATGRAARPAARRVAPPPRSRKERTRPRDGRRVP
jgi:A/G-specific adenine glycosylase